MAAAPIPGLGMRDECPRPNPAADPRAATLSPQEGWVLSRVDGHTSFGELCLITGLGEEQTVVILKGLAARGLILTRNGPAALARAAPPAPARPHAQPVPAPAPAQPPSPPKRPVAQPAPPLRAPSSLLAREWRSHASDGARPDDPELARRVAEAAEREARELKRKAIELQETAAAATRARLAAATEEESLVRAAQEQQAATARIESTLAPFRAALEAAQAAEARARDAVAHAQAELARVTAERALAEQKLADASRELTGVHGAASQAVQRAHEATQRREHSARLEADAAARAAAATTAARVTEEIALRADQHALELESPDLGRPGPPIFALPKAGPPEPRAPQSARAARAAQPGPKAPASDLSQILRNYASEVDRPGPRDDGPEPTPAKAARAEAAPEVELATETSAVVPISAAAAEELDPALLGQAPALPLSAKKRIVRKHQRIAQDDLFELLEIPLDSGKKEVKRSYYKLSKEFHPDRYFGKRLGPYKALIDDIFKALSQAADFLTDDTRRAEYEAMIRTQHEMRDLERTMQRATEAALEESRRLAEGAAAEPAPLPEHERERAGRAPSGPVPPGGRAPTPRAVPIMPPGGAPARRLVRQVIGQRLLDERLQKGRHHFEEGSRLASLGQWVAAAGSFKLAATFAPENPEYQGHLQQAQEEAAALQATTHFRRGVFEESAGRFDTAARCYEHAATLQPTFQPCVKAAEMFLKIRELNRAREYGIKAVELDPTNASGHLTLAQVFREAKQFKDAKRSLERVMKLDPENKTARSLLKEVQKLA